MARAADQRVIDAGGLVGRHVGDGVVAFFLAETAGSESAAARSCIQAARAVREAMSGVAGSSCVGGVIDGDRVTLGQIGGPREESAGGHKDAAVTGELLDCGEQRCHGLRCPPRSHGNIDDLVAGEVERGESSFVVFQQGSCRLVVIVFLIESGE